MREGKGIQATVALIFASVTAWLGYLAIPVYVLLACNVIDYATGLMAAKNRGEKPNSYKGLTGIAKKVCQWLLIVVGALIDWLVVYATSYVRPDFTEPYIVAIIVAIWLAFNEMISILENIRDIGVVLPPFLIALVEKLKKKTEDVANGGAQSEKEENGNGKEGN